MMSSTSIGSRQFDAVLALPFCRLGLQFENQRLVASEYLPADSKSFSPRSSYAVRVAEQVHAYCEDPGFQFSLKLNPPGTKFQQRVWKQLLAIPSGEVMTYGEVAKKLGSSPRAVGNACRANHIPLIIPCHRVIAASGLGGFAGHRSGYFLDIKRQLLRHEGLEF